MAFMRVEYAVGYDAQTSEPLLLALVVTSLDLCESDIGVKVAADVGLQALDALESDFANADAWSTVVLDARASDTHAQTG